VKSGVTGRPRPDTHFGYCRIDSCEKLNLQIANSGASRIAFCDYESLEKFLEIKGKSPNDLLAHNLQENPMMKHRGLPSSVRFAALVVLIAWVTSLAICSVECLVGQCGSEKAEVANVGHQHSDSHEHQDKSPSGHAPGSCPDEKTPCSALASTILPDAFSYTPHPGVVTAVLPDLQSSPALPQKCGFARISRYAKRGNRVFEPEVCLGPAFRSLAPPAA
jgi:hypothetical protein